MYLYVEMKAAVVLTALVVTPAAASYNGSLLAKMIDCT